MTTNCKSCNAPITPGFTKCDYCGSAIPQEQNTSHATIVGDSAKIYIGDQINNIIKPNSYESQIDSIKPQLTQPSAAGTHWTAIIAFIISILIFLGSLGADKSKDTVVGYLFLASLAFFFNYLAIKSFKVQNWMTKTNFVLIAISSLIIFLNQL